MPRIIIQADPPAGQRADIRLSERVVAVNLNDPHYGAQLLERLTWATADAEALESRSGAREPGDDALPSPLRGRRKSARVQGHLRRAPLSGTTVPSA
jgi:hypothetical protein